MTLDHQIVNVCDGKPWIDPTTAATTKWRRCAVCDRMAQENRARIDREGT
jgi:hypothetical protein